MAHTGDRRPMWPWMLGRRRYLPPTAMPTGAVVFDSETGAYKRHWGAYGKKPIDEKMPRYPMKPPSQQFGSPVHCIRIDKEGLVYVCDRSNNRLQIFKKDGTFVTEHIYEKTTARDRIGL
jgi:hypothetical protein